MDEGVLILLTGTLGYLEIDNICFMFWEFKITSEYDSVEIS